MAKVTTEEVNSLLDDAEIFETTEEPIIGKAISDLKEKDETKLTDYSITHTTSKKIIMFDPTGEAREVVKANFRVLRLNGFTLNCPFCNKPHKTIDVNECEARDKRAFSRCPVCAAHGREKKIYDDVEPVETSQSLDDGELKLKELHTFSPEQRVWKNMLAHFANTHESYYRSMVLKAGNAPE